MTTIHQLRTNLEQAQQNYLSADIEHPTAVLVAKDLLTNARFDYWAACADLVTRLPDVIKIECENLEGSGECCGPLAELYMEITGETV